MLLEELKVCMRRLGVDFELMPDRVSVSGLPLFVSAVNDFVSALFCGENVTLALARKNGLMPQDIVAQWRALSKSKAGSFVMVLRPAEEAYCKILDAAKVDYIMPGSRLHVTGKAILVMKRATDGGYRPKGRMTIAAQEIVLYHLLRETGTRTVIAALPEALGMGKAQVSVAARELERLDLCGIDRVWKDHRLVWSDDRHAIWQHALPMLASPVQRRMRVRSVPRGLPVAGIAALAEVSNLAADAVETYAISRKDPRARTLATTPYEGDWIEVWKYDPQMFASERGRVDRLSLYLSLKDDPDPRVQGELNAMMEEFNGKRT